jgi:hypothetical protein
MTETTWMWDEYKRQLKRIYFRITKICRLYLDAPSHVKFVFDDEDEQPLFICKENKEIITYPDKYKGLVVLTGKNWPGIKSLVNTAPGVLSTFGTVNNRYRYVYHNVTINKQLIKVDGPKRAIKI